MKNWLLSVILILVICWLSWPVEAQEREAYKVYDEGRNLKGYVKKKLFADAYEILDRNYQRKGHIKRSRYTGRYEIYDENWNRVGTISVPERRRKER